MYGTVVDGLKKLCRLFGCANCRFGGFWLSQASHQNYLLDLQLGGSPLNLLLEIPYATAAQEETRHRPTGRKCHGEPDGCWLRCERTRVLHRTTIHFWDSSGRVVGRSRRRPTPCPPPSRPESDKVWLGWSSVSSVGKWEDACLVLLLGTWWDFFVLFLRFGMFTILRDNKDVLSVFLAKQPLPTWENNYSTSDVTWYTLQVLNTVFRRSDLVTQDHTH